MRTVKYGVIAGLVVIAMLAANVQGAFLIEALPGGLANENFTGDPSISTAYPLGSTAVGCQANNGVFGQIPAGPDVYVFSYTPGTDADNVTITEGTDLGNGDLASGLDGGWTGAYNVYATWCASTNVDADGCYFTTTSDGADTVTDTINQNTGQSGSPGGTNAWLLIAENVILTEGVTYTITQTANDPSFVSMRSHGVMWEAVIPDSAPVTVVESGDSTDVTEGGTWDDYTVVLDQPPVSDYVYVHMSPREDDPNNPDIVFVVGEGRVSGPLTLTFLPGDWNIPQTVRVEAVDDEFVEFDHDVIIPIATEPNDPALDPDFADSFGGFVKVNITDNEVADVRIVESGDSTDVSEQGLTDTYLVKLLFPPTDDVTVTITTDGETTVDLDDGAGPVLTGALVFTTTNWGDERTVTVSAIDDDVFEDTHTSTITHSVGSLDGGYDGLEVRDVVVLVEDNECGVWGFVFMDFDEDCVVGLSDFAEFAAAWLECTQPYGDNCIDLR